MVKTCLFSEHFWGQRVSDITVNIMKHSECIHSSCTTPPRQQSPLVETFQVRDLSKDWASRAALPGHVVTMLNNFPSNVHPMSQLVAACSALNSESKFAKAYSEGTHKTKYWEVKDAKFSRFLEE